VVTLACILVQSELCLYIQRALMDGKRIWRTSRGTSNATMQVCIFFESILDVMLLLGTLFPSVPHCCYCSYCFLGNLGGVGGSPPGINIKILALSPNADV
jgi:hypothetical protein